MVRAYQKVEQEGEVQVKLQSLPVIKITPTAKQKLQYYIDICEKEISGLGLVEREGENFLITDIFLFKQIVTSVSTDLSQEDIGKFLHQAIKEGQDVSKIRLWWHSHVNMGTFWSTHADEPTIEGLGESYMISLVGNKAGMTRCRLDLYSPFRITLDNLPMVIQFPKNQALEEQCKKEIKKKVKTSMAYFWRRDKGEETRDVSCRRDPLGLGLGNIFSSGEVDDFYRF